MLEGRCVHHPSRETALRCRECDRWICERCQRRIGSQAYCRPWCAGRGLVRDALRAGSDLLRRPVEPVRAGAALALAGLALAATLVSLGALLLAERVPTREQPGAPPTPAPQAELVAVVHEGPQGWRMVVEGPPGGRVLVSSNGQPLAVLTLDGQGRGETAGDGAPGTELELAAVDGEPVRPRRLPPSPPVAPSPAPATATPLPAPPTTPTTTATASPTARPTASPAAAPEPPTTSSSPPLAPTPGGPPVLHLVTDAGPLIAITFDGGASSNGTAQLLELLRELDLRATLFLTGEFIQREPGLLRRALLDGHEVGNHTWSHPRLTTYAEDRHHRLRPGITREWFQAELRRTEEAFRAATGRPLAPLWRAPYGEENGSLRAWAAELGYLHVRWSSLEGSSLDSWDWVADEHSALFEDADQMVDRLLRFPRLEGGIVLMHLASDRTEPPWKALPRLVATLREREIAPVPVTELLQKSPSWRSRLERVTRRHRQLNPE